MNRNKAMQAFRDYTNAYHADRDERVRLKIVHTMHVVDIMEQLAESLRLNQEQTDLAWLIALLHDIGRFEQVRIYETFIDADSIDHAKYGVKVLFEEGHIRDFIEETTYDDMIRQAISYHNMFRIPADITEEVRFYSDLIRDADKLDILRVNVESSPEILFQDHIENIRQYEICEAAMEDFMNCRVVMHKHKKTAIDHVIGHASLAFELVYTPSYEIAKKQGYLDRILAFASDNPVTQQQFEQLRDCMKQYIDSRLQETICG